MLRSRTVSAALVLTLLVALFVAWHLRESANQAVDAARPELMSANSRAAAPSFVDANSPSPNAAPDELFDRDLADSLGWNFHGLVLDETRKPLLRFGVRATRLGTVADVVERIEIPVEEHENGEFALSNLTPGHWCIAPFAPERRLVLERNFWELETKRHDYLLLPLSYFKDDLKPARLHGVALLPTGRPAPYAQVAAYAKAIDPDHPIEAAPAATTSADSEGRFLLTVAPGQKWLTASLPEFDDALPVALELTEGESRTGLQLRLTDQRRARFWFAAADPARPRPLTLKWFEIHGDHEGSVVAEEGVEFEVPLAGTGTYRWELACEPDALHAGLFESPRSQPAPTFRLARRAATPVVVHFPKDCIEEGIAIATDPSMGALPLVRARKGRDSTEFELPCGGRWRFAYSTAVLDRSAFAPTHDIPVVTHFEVPCPNALQGVLQDLGY